MSARQAPFIFSNATRQRLGTSLTGSGISLAVDTNPGKFELARSFGATECINPKDHEKPIQQVITEATGWDVDHASSGQVILATVSSVQKKRRRQSV